MNTSLNQSLPRCRENVQRSKANHADTEISPKLVIAERTVVKVAVTAFYHIESYKRGKKKIGLLDQTSRQNNITLAKNTQRKRPGRREEIFWSKWEPTMVYDVVGNDYGKLSESKTLNSFCSLHRLFPSETKQTVYSCCNAEDKGREPEDVDSISNSRTVKTLKWKLHSRSCYCGKECRYGR